MEWESGVSARSCCGEREPPHLSSLRAAWHKPEAAPGVRENKTGSQQLPFIWSGFDIPGQAPLRLHTHAHTHARTHTCINTHMHMHTCTNTHTHAHMRMHTRTHAHMHKHTYAHAGHRAQQTRTEKPQTAVQPDSQIHSKNLSTKPRNQRHHHPPPHAPALRPQTPTAETCPCPSSSQEPCGLQKCRCPGGGGEKGEGPTLNSARSMTPWRRRPLSPTGSRGTAGVPDQALKVEEGKDALAAHGAPAHGRAGAGAHEPARFQAPAFASRFLCIPLICETRGDDVFSLKLL